MIDFSGILFTIALGTLLHFTYEWSGRNLLISFLAPTNESVFEHLKMLTTPFLLWSLNEYVHYGQFAKNFIPAKTFGLLAGILVLVLSFYSYTTVCSRNFLFADIILFAASVSAAFLASHVLILLPALGAFPFRLLSAVTLFLLLSSFIVFSICPPQHVLFNSPYHFRRKPPCK